jgi:hypothetical protein
MVLLHIVSLVGGVISVGVVELVGGVKLLPLQAVGDEVGGVTGLQATPGSSPPLLTELVQGTELSCQQGNLIIRDALILFIRSCSKR